MTFDPYARAMEIVDEAEAAGHPLSPEARNDLQNRIAESLLDTYQLAIEDGRIASSVLTGSEERERKHETG